MFNPLVLIPFSWCQLYRINDGKSFYTTEMGSISISAPICRLVSGNNKQVNFKKPFLSKKQRWKQWSTRNFVWIVSIYYHWLVNVLSLIVLLLLHYLFECVSNILKEYYDLYNFIANQVFAWVWVFADCVRQMPMHLPYSVENYSI